MLTGANATGKSTLLGILARHFNWSRTFSPTPLTLKRGSEWISVGRRRAKRLVRGSEWANVGALFYESGDSTRIDVPTGGALHGRMPYDLHLPNQQRLTGAFINSHRSVSGNYSPVEHIPVSFLDAEQLFEAFTNEIRTRWSGGWTGKSPQLALKEALLAAALFGGRGNENVEFNEQAYSIWTGFHSILEMVMPKSLGFRRLRVRGADIILESRAGDFILDDASGGLNAILEMAWQIFLRSRTHDSFTVLIDEPENHLHPSLQREFLPSLLGAFPRVQFVVATHSPFVVTARPDSKVYALDYNERHRVTARELDYANKAASADETLRRVLGLESTMPKWAATLFDTIVDRYSADGLSIVRLNAMRSELRAQGLESRFPEALNSLVDRLPDTDRHLDDDE